MNVLINPNWVAYLALALWPVVAVCFYVRLPIGRATLWTLLAAYLLLPVGAEIKIAGVPALDKGSIPNLTALVCCAISAGRLPRLFRSFGVVEILCTVFVISPFVTSMLNSDPVRTGAVYLPGMDSYDALSASVAQFIFIIPFFLARDFLRSADDNALILRFLVVSALAYSVLMLIEIRMSPQLNVWVYGYFAHEFIQQVRDGSFRPVVFMGHSLTVGFFIMTAAVAAGALWRTGTQIGRLTAGRTAFYLGFILVLSRTFASTMYGLLLVPLVRWGSLRLQLRIAAVLALIALGYPILRTVDLIPTATVLDAAEMVSSDRAQSLRVRFINEKILLDHALERPWFGWGRFGRNRVFDPLTGRDFTVTDGRWIIILGTFGIVGFVAEFGLLGFAVFQATVALRSAQLTREIQYTAALALIVGISMIDQLPNSTLSSWSWLLAGALLGRAEMLLASNRRRPITTGSQPYSKQINKNEIPT